ncbi:MAG: hypothetical protein SFX18_06855 [Pirellulales bacterium]|nr:hypothetical protein [Pirellulales bacterium]
MLIFLFCAIIGGTILVCQFALTLMGLSGAEGSDFDLHTDGLGDASLSGDGHLDHPGGNGGLGGDAHGGQGHDSGHEQHGSSWFFGVLTFRTVVTFIAFFGLIGMVGTSAGWPQLQTLVVAVGSGLMSMYGVQYLLRLAHRLRADGTVHIQRAVGQPAIVYLTIPPKNSGLGKVQVVLQNRTMEYDAMTPHEKLPTGTRVLVTRVLGADRVEVAAETMAG